MAIVAILFYFVTIKNNPNNINGNLLAIGLKFIFSALVFIIYIVAFKSKSNTDYYFFILAYVVYSIICYAGAYFYKKSISTK